MNPHNDPKGAAVKFPPPLVFLLILLAAYGIDRLFPLRIGNSQFLALISAGALLAGIGILLCAAILFKRAQTPLEPWKPTSTIITGGIYAYSRNPMYTGFCFVQIALGLYLNSYWVLFSFLPAAYLVYHTAIRKEEIYLENKFGDEYLQYKNRVRRWL